MAKARNESNDQKLKNELAGIGFIVMALIMLVSVLSPENRFFGDGAGAIGSFIAKIMAGLTGDGKYIIPLILIIWGVKLLLGSKKSAVINEKLPGITIISLTILATLTLQVSAEYWNISAAFQGHGGGIIGLGIILAFTYLFGTSGTIIIVIACYFVGFLLLTKSSISDAVVTFFNWLGSRYLNYRDKIIDFIYVNPDDGGKAASKKETATKSSKKIEYDEIDLPLEEGEAFSYPGSDTKSSQDTLEPNPVKEFKIIKPKQDSNSIPVVSESTSVEECIDILKENPKKEFVLPPLSILQRNINLKSTRIEKDITEKVKLLEETLASFGITVKVNQVSKGPTITRFEMQPAPGVKVSKIVNLADDIALALAASTVRIEAPIPGKAAVGIEVPNKEVSVVTFRETLETEAFQHAASKLSVALGKDIAGNPIVANLQSMPHLLIAGATGSGKSVCMNTIIASLLYKATPDELKLLMIDPKMVELTNYNGIPHLISPVVTDSRKAAASLKWVVEEMETRYELFAKNGVKDITRFNKLKSNSSELVEELLPYIVVLIDELADLMMVAPVDVEDSICRLAQMARAAGIHLVVATQRPSVDVITGLIKANIPSRIAFAVSSQTDSRTILDMGGAEKLLGRGDMLYYPTGAPKPVRVQGCYLSDKEVEDVVTFLKHQGQPEYLKGIIDTQANTAKADVLVEQEEPLFFEAGKLVIEHGQASISMLQRRLHIGYNRAARLVDMLEEQGVIGGYEGNKPRNILMSMEDLEILQDVKNLPQEEIQ